MSSEGCDGQESRYMGIFVVIVTLKHRSATAIQITWRLYGQSFMEGNFDPNSKAFSIGVLLYGI